MPKPSVILPGYEWVPAAHNYRRPNGTFIKRGALLDLLSDAISQNERAMLKEVTGYVEGRIAMQTWIIGQSETLRREYLQNAALGAGGWDRLTQADYGRIGGKLRAEYARIANLAEQVAAKEVTLPQALNRVHMYQGGARRMFYETERGHLPGAGQGKATIERRVLGEAEHCGDCIAFYDEGWQPVGALPVPGAESECDGNCRCDLLRQSVPAAEIDQWIGTKG